jgi:hypothetical protein
MNEPVVYLSVSRLVFVMLEIACPGWKALHVQAEDGYHSNIDGSREIEGHIVEKLEQRHATI